VAETSGQSAAATRTTPKLFVRQSSGLVRNVSVTDALFFNVAAFVGVGLTLYTIFYSLPDVQAWRRDRSRRTAGRRSSPVCSASCWR